MAITVIAKLKVKPGNEAAFKDAAAAMIQQVKTESGTQTYILHQDAKDPTSFVYYEVYGDQAAFDAHGKTAHMAEFGKKIGALLDGRPQIDILHEVTRK
ncbi:MAG TPA: putative quinol monooxygenase [Candidatus Binataceae bacterium]|jgi:quinol monooxygenase YgiN